MEKKTKIIATISDLKCEKDFLKSLLDSGADAFRVNTAWQEPEDTLKIVKNIRAISESVPIIVDTKGPEMRTSSKQEEFTVKVGDKVKMGYDLKEDDKMKSISITYKDFFRDVPVGKQILIDDGSVSFMVEKKEKDTLICKVENDGIVERKKSVNVPGVHIDLPSLNDKDRRYVDFCIKHDIDFIAHSFVRNKEDLLEIQKILDKSKSKVKLIAKIESQEGVDNIDEILDYCYGVMVARGDLGIEIPIERIPVIQKNLIQRCRIKRKIVIVATQMLHSMIKNPRPTRSEVTDIANAVVQGTDCIMLSGETSLGNYPQEAVGLMVRVSKEIEKEREPFTTLPIRSIQNEISSFLAKSAVRASLSLPVRSIVADTMSGRTARYISAFRSRMSVFVKCYDKRVVRELSLSYGIYPSYMKREKTADDFTKKSLKELVENKFLKKEDLVVVLAGSFGPTHGASFIEVSKVENLLNGK